MQPMLLISSNAKLSRSSWQLSGDEIRHTRKTNVIVVSHAPAGRGWFPVQATSSVKLPPGAEDAPA